MASDDLATKLGIATYIGNGNGRSIYDIAVHFGISVRTAYRFLDRLQAEGYPLTNEERRNGKGKLWTMLDLNRDKYGNVLPASEFSQEECILLHYIMAELKKSEDILPSIKSVRNKLATMLSQKTIAFPSLDYSKNISRKLFPIESIKSISKITSKEIQNNNFFNRNNKIVYTGRILHLDGDKKYSEKSNMYYKKMGLKAIVKNITERNQVSVANNLIERYNPDIVVITGHDRNDKIRKKL